MISAESTKYSEIPSFIKEEDARATVFNVLVLLILLVGAFFIYLPGLQGAYFGDDFQNFVDPPPDSSLYFFHHRLDPRPHAYRPLEATVLLLIQRHFGLETWPIHVLQVVLHAILSWVVFVWMRHRSFSLPQSLVASVIMLVSQANVYAVLSNDTFSQVSGTLLGCFTILLLARSHSSNEVGLNKFSVNRFSVGTYWCSVACFSLALFAKETSVSFFPMACIVIGTILYRKVGWRRAFKPAIFQILPFLLFLLIYLAARSALEIRQSAFGSDRYDFHLGFNILKNMGQFILQAFLPISSVTVFRDIVQHNIPVVFSAGLATIALILITSRQVLILKKRRILLLVVVFAFLGLFPVIMLNKASELYLYNSMPFIAILSGSALGYFLEKKNTPTRIRTFSFFLIVMIASSHVWAVRNKARQMTRCGETATSLLSGIYPYLKEVPPNGTLFLVNPAQGPTEYSVFLVRGFNPLINGTVRLNQLAKRKDLKVHIIDPDDLANVSLPGSVILGLSDGKTVVNRIR